MPRLAARILPGDYLGPYREFQALIDRRLEYAALQATDQAARIAVSSIRSAMTSAGLGRLGNGLGNASDLSSGRGIHRRGDGGWSASGIVFIRSRSERTRGAIESYTEGANIAPVRGRWLWMATDQIPQRAGRHRMTPALYNSSGLAQKIGPLTFVRSVNGFPLLVVKDVGVSAAGKTRSAKSLTKRGLPRKAQIAKEFVVCFIGIPRTAQAARVDVPGILKSVQAQLPDLFARALERT